MHLCVLGAGVIGVTSAYRLLQDGHQVTLIDAAPQAGHGTSFGNGAQLSYSYVAPLADPSIWSHWAHYLFSADSPLTLRPQIESAQWRWLLSFLGACNARQVKSTTIALLRLAFHSRDEMNRLQKNSNIEFSHRVAGKLVLYSDAEGLQSARRQVDFQAQFGCKQEVIDLQRCLEIEPALAGAQRTWAGGVYTPSEAVGDCAQFCQGLVDTMQQNTAFRFLSATTIQRPVMQQGRIQSVQTSAGKIEADAFVLAIGSESVVFAQQAGVRLPLYPLKGYSITVPLDDTSSQQAAPQVSITDLSRKIVYARLDNRLRVAGRVELVGRDRSIPARAIGELQEGVRTLFPGSLGNKNDHNGNDSASRLSPWTGFRPATPSGVPIVGASPIDNLYLNLGQGALGWTLACGSAAVLAAKIGGYRSAIDDAPFRYQP
ncbi:D-amino-acid dehydrogenase [Herbaspirillum sp. Sphag1AN]|uniref:D-amino acid dehydrogenase n=1 Tax=unclassified Herbaspirillum TaxID=2624150 RepID=UPI00161A50CA|nr:MULTISPECIES: D-amino acid dehydrogenase [unclassified Herbaspirillum]MBB3213715.1 D-amino-acid dehydrogenase [Herbaspirillum sp. Sphag1AN]MBB3246912.1 D-amino-acid dehydrogenase [Herbaspirillum sp. Sphag64]